MPPPPQPETPSSQAATTCWGTGYPAVRWAAATEHPSPVDSELEAGSVPLPASGTSDTGVPTCYRRVPEQGDSEARPLRLSFWRISRGPVRGCPNRVNGWSTHSPDTWTDGLSPAQERRRCAVVRSAPSGALASPASPVDSRGLGNGVPLPVVLSGSVPRDAAALQPEQTADQTKACQLSTGQSATSTLNPLCRV